MKAPGKQALLAALTLFVLLGLIEGVLSLLALVSPAVYRLLSPPWRTPQVVATRDPRLEYRAKPGSQDHDTMGFRNRRHPQRADIVALGDSQTYGTGVDRESAWPQQLGRMMTATVYNMAFGGYGPVHALTLWDEAMNLHPAIVIYAYYSGNDLWDSFRMVYPRRQHRELASSDLDRKTRIEEAEAAGSLGERAARAASVLHPSALPRRDDPRGAVPMMGHVGDLVAQYSSIHGLGRRMWYEATRTALEPNQAWDKAQAFAREHPEYCQILSTDRFRTILTPKYRLLALDLSDDRIVEGLHISLRALRRLKQGAEGSANRFMVLTIPTKELVFSILGGRPSKDHLALVENETQMWSVIKDFLATHAIEHIDALPALQKELREGVQPYPISHEGHPNAHGYRAIARAVAAQLKMAEGLESVAPRRNGGS